MVSYQNSILNRCLPLTTFERVRELLQQMAQRFQGDTHVNFSKKGKRQAQDLTLFLTEDVVSSVELPQGTLPERFALLISKRFSAWFFGDWESEKRETESPNGKDNLLTTNCQLSIPNAQFLRVGLTFEPTAIVAFLTQISNLVENNLYARQTLQAASQIPQSNDPTLQSEFTLSLLEIFSQDREENNAAEKVYPYVSVCQPVHNALSQQIEQERLLNQVTTQIRQSLELPVILNTAVEQVRNFLQADRLIVYEFHCDTIEERHNSKIASSSGDYHGFPVNRNADSNFPDPLYPLSSLDSSSCYGRITYEAKADDSIPSVLHLAEEGYCFIKVPKFREKYRKGFALAVEDIETAYIFSPCLLDLMRNVRVRAKLAVPIVIQEQLWGLLIVHQCFQPRQWQENEKNFLRQIAEHLAIAIYQAQLYAQLQQQKQTLEQRVIERTQELHDAMLAAQSASRTKGEFLATMSHELRTPLTCVIGLSATLLRWSFGQLSQKQRDYLQTIHDNGEHLLELINDILELSQMEAGKTVLNISDISLSLVAQYSLQIVREKALQRGVELAINLRISPSQDRFLADGKRVKQILFNLLTNGIKFTPSGGRVTLRVWLEGTQAVFQVEDTGIGISQEQLPLIFQKFQQLDTSYHRQYEGTGLGLALTKQLVELHRGRIEVDSRVGEGSIFTVWLPLPPSPPSPNDPRIPIMTDLPQGRIVLIENDEETANLICDILTAAGYQIVWIIEGTTAIKQIEILQPLAALVEINLSGLNGYEVIRQLRNSSAISNLKILAITATEIPTNPLYGLGAEPDDYLKKPVQPQELLHKVQLLMANN
ncbi:GAF domain-containing protein [Planktothrix sp. FACHB-1355]|uniref:histidine kinase n=1 Tax=Aerosakkonema funiforme FACHB-1375 TaxID=2949571 RepID=A0A926VEQ6_9CYAN|nr:MULTISPECIES: GAF domain-containing hybrid sensor histidine kinase/response regulator [Oscillatoriales]MBD2182419.1 GAF domain-containing protein [Aerosakkonema funiforme FACHB-1375]MBD3560401.1 GAF domain-containing protein [Planktothrix sp. FACHB-1355]